MRARHNHKKIIALMTLGSLIVSLGLFCQISFFPSTPAAAATVAIDKIGVINNSENCAEESQPTAGKTVPVAPSHNKNTSGLLLCCYQNNADSQLSQTPQNFSERLTAYPLRPISFAEQYPKISFSIFSHAPPLASVEQLKTMVKRE